MFKKLSKDFFLYTIGPQIPRVVNFLLLPLYTKYLTTFDYGISGIINSYLGLLGGIADLGLSIRFSITFFKHPAAWRNRWSVLSGILLRWSLLFAVLQSLLLLALLPGDMGTKKYVVIGLNFITVLLFSSWNTLCTSLLQYQQRSVLVSCLNVTLGLLTVLFNYIFIIRLRMGYLGWFYTTFIVSISQGIFSVYWLFIHNKIRISRHFSVKPVLKILFITIPLVFHNYSTYLLDSSDRVVMSLLKVPIERIGLYNFAYIFAFYFDFATTAAGIAAGPIIARNFYSKSSRKYENNKNLIIFFQMVFLAVAFTGSLLLKDFLEVYVSNQEMKKANYLACILIFSYCYKPMYWYVNTILSYNNKTSELWKMSFTTGVLNVLLNLALVPFLGIYACALSTMVCLLFMAILGSTFRNFKSLNRVPFSFYFWVIGILVLCGISMLLQQQPILVKLGILVVVNIIAFKYVYGFYRSKVSLIQAEEAPAHAVHS